MEHLKIAFEKESGGLHSIGARSSHVLILIYKATL